MNTTPATPLTRGGPGGRSEGRHQLTLVAPSSSRAAHPAGSGRRRRLRRAVSSFLRAVAESATEHPEQFFG